MNRKKKKSFAAWLSAFMAAAAVVAALPQINATAAVKKVPLSNEIDNVYWNKQGNENVYSLNEQQPVFKNASGYACLGTCDTVKGDKDVYAEFYLRSFDSAPTGTQILFQPYSETLDGMTELLYTTAERTIGQHTSTGNYGDWSGPDFEYGGSWEAPLSAVGLGGWDHGPKYVTKIRYVGRADGSVSYYVWEQDEANRSDVFAWREKYRTKPADESKKNYFAAPSADKDYHILFAVNGAAEISEIEFGTIEESAEDKTNHLLTDKSVLTKTVGTQDAADGTLQKDKTAAGKIYMSQGRIIAYGETVVTNPTKDDMLVTTMEVYKDSIAEKVFEVDTALELKTLSEGRKVGVGVVPMSADEINAKTADSEGASYFYFEKKGDKTYLGQMNDGEFVKEYELESLNGKFDLNILADKTGDVTVTVGETPYEFENAYVEGYIAIASLGTGDVTYLIDTSLRITRFGYTSSEGEAMECNFDGWMNPQKFFVDTHNTSGFADPQQSVGVEVSDGSLFFNGSGTNSVLSPIGMYADFVFEFDYTSFAIEDRPQKAAGWMFGYSDMTIAFGNETPYGWGQGAYQIFIRDYSTRQWENDKEPYQGYGEIKFVNWMDGGKTVGDAVTISTGTDTVDEATGKHIYTSVAKDGYLSLYNATTRIKLVVADNKAVLYACTMTEGKALSEYSADDYVKLGEWDVPEALEGRVSVCADENAYFKIDNVRITPLDGQTEGDVAKNLAAYVDFKEIANEERPVQLTAPVLALDGKTVTWEQVEGATGYEVSVNGGENIRVDGTSYTLSTDEAGAYEIAVRALGDGDKKLDSNYAKITCTVGGTENPGGASSSGGNSDSPDAGCGSAVGGMALSAIAVLAAAFVLGKKKD